MKIVLILFLIVCLVALWVGYHKYRHVRGMNQWEQTKAQVISFDLEEYNMNSQGGAYKISAEYEYTVEGKKYRSTQLSTDDPVVRSLRGTTKIFGSANPTEFMIYYDPRNPEYSVAVLQNPIALLAILIVAGLFAVISVLIYLRL